MSKELWIEAGKMLALDPKVSVKCPDCGEADLKVFDTPAGATHFERHLRCLECGAYNAQLKRIDGV
ncbi:MAG: hypothetical protein E5V49_05265 [Mesorhizobium sp.]|nr:hypothetical protein EN848_20945 [bacterium M00.F.Ca.ET.205.01.1.1]TGU50742.1 hypothetical protein EN795_20490 [bacterium M00.F.Ca.ET.152.01.1.1]TGV34233.1 hypothetical protein EN829_018440 [Mesorhizobium sp. M00.F.Ca.ET.186.01.1.1]TGZ42099.1 hypothetical protein EN805_17605 [bacterium M00.F.Ca.ET.162.01.1.1]TJW33971.1 MAG: hypothetical protein E5V49_05265 [Mesorhizobium sp.]